MHTGSISHSEHLYAEGLITYAFLEHELDVVSRAIAQERYGRPRISLDKRDFDPAYCEMDCD